MVHKKLFSALFALSMLTLSLPMTAMNNNSGLSDQEPKSQTQNIKKDEEKTKFSFGQWWNEQSTTGKVLFGGGTTLGSLLFAYTTYKIFSFKRLILCTTTAATTVGAFTGYIEARDYWNPEDKDLSAKEKISKDFEWAKQKVCNLCTWMGGLFGACKKQISKDQNDQ